MISNDKDRLNQTGNRRASCWPSPKLRKMLGPVSTPGGPPTASPEGGGGVLPLPAAWRGWPLWQYPGTPAEGSGTQQMEQLRSTCGQPGIPQKCPGGGEGTGADPGDVWTLTAAPFAPTSWSGMESAGRVGSIHYSYFAEEEKGTERDIGAGKTPNMPGTHPRPGQHQTPRGRTDSIQQPEKSQPLTSAQGCPPRRKALALPLLTPALPRGSRRRGAEQVTCSSKDPDSQHLSTSPSDMLPGSLLDPPASRVGSPDTHVSQRSDLGLQPRSGCCFLNVLLA